VGPPAYASSSHSSVLLLASVAVSRMLCPAVRHGMPASWRAVPREAPAAERSDLSQGAGSGTNWGRSRGRRERHQHSHAARAVPRTGRPSGWVCRPGCTRGLGIGVFAVVPGLLGHRGSLAATSMRSTPGAPTIWLDRVGLGVRRRRWRTQQPPPVIAVGFYGAWTRYPKRPRMYFTRSGDEERGHFDSLHRAGRRLMLCWFGQRPPDSSAFGKGCVWLASSSEMVAPRAAASSSSVGTASRTDGGRAS